MEITNNPFFYLILFNIVASLYMMYKFIRNYFSLRKYLTKQQIKERRANNGIGMTEAMILLTFATGTSFIMGFISSFYLLNGEEEAYNIVKIFWFVPTIATALAMGKMVRISSKGKDNGIGGK